MRTKFPVPIAVARTEFQNSVEVFDNAITGVSSTAMTRNLPLPYHCRRAVLADDQCSHDSNTIACVVRRTEPKSRGTTAIRKNELQAAEQNSSFASHRDDHGVAAAFSWATKDLLMFFLLLSPYNQLPETGGVFFNENNQHVMEKSM